MPYLNLFCAFGRLQGGVPCTFEHAQRESREKYTFCNVEHLSRWYGVLARVSGWYGVDCRLAGLCISFTIGWLNEIGWWGWVYLLSSVPSLPDYRIKFHFYFSGSWIAGLICPLLSRFASTVSRASLQICQQRSFCTVCQRNDRLWDSLKKWTMNF